MPRRRRPDGASLNLVPTVQQAITSLLTTYEPEFFQAYVHDKYVTELVNGVFLPETRDGLLRVIETLQGRDHIDAVILAGTELPLI